jgi:hypothetical protein
MNNEPPPPERDLPAQMRQDLVLYLANQFRVGVERTSTLLGAWVSALFLILFASILPVAGKLERVEGAKARAARAWIELQHLTRQSDTVRNRIINPRITESTHDDTLRVTAAGHSDSIRLHALEAGIARLQRDTADARRGIDSIAHDIAHIPTPIGTLPVSYYYLAVIWIVLLIVLLTLFLYKRLLLISLLVRTVMIDPDGEFMMPGHGAWAPFWLAPLPKLSRAAGTDARVPSEAELQRFLGWRSDGKWRARLLYIGLGIMLLAYSGVAYLAVRVSSVDYPISRTEPALSMRMAGEAQRRDMAERLRRISISSYDPQATVNMTVLVSALLVAVLTLCINILRVPLHVGGYPERVLAISRRRRRFLQLSAWGLGLGVIYTLLPRRYPFHYIAAGKPRFRRMESIGQMERLAHLFAGKFGINRTSRVVHYVNRAGWMIGGIAPSPANVAPLDLYAVARVLRAPLSPPSEAEAPSDTMNDAARIRAVKPLPMKPLPMKVAAPIDDEGRAGEARIVGGHRIKRRRRLKGMAPHIPAPRHGPLAEYAALMLVGEGDSAQAIAVLWSAIMHDTAFKKGRGGRPNRRLYELLAGLAVRFSSPGDISRLGDYVAEQWPHDRLSARRNVWRAPASRWRSRWIGKRFPWDIPHEKDDESGAV